MPRQRSLFDAEEREPSFPSSRRAAPTAFVPLASLAPPEGPRRTGIARAAARAPEVDFRNEVEYRDLACRTLLTSVNSRRVPFDYAINPYRGCEFGCTYCYARYTHEYMELEDWLDFERKIFLKRNARDALLADLRRLDVKGAWIAIGTATDPYQPAERRFGLTRALLEVFAARSGLRLSITTKSDLVRRDAALLAEISRRNELHVNVTITTPHYELSRRTEPRAPRPDKRLAAVRTLADAGVMAGVFVMPVLPRINDRVEDLELLVRLAKESGADYLAAQVLFLRNCSKKRFFPFLEERFPELLPYYRRLYAGYRTDALAQYTRQKYAEIHALRSRYGLTTWGRSADGPRLPGDQLLLPDC
ncbi:MAG TPA: radical SAM protein [Armatimonadota bacterium]|nr:radical SAM protein [Armatimonadota bacterium]